MVMPVNSVASALPNIANIAPINGTTVNDAAGAVANGGGKDFGSAISDALNALNGLHQKADSLAQSAATGNAQDISQYMIASQEASVATELAVSVRNRAVEAFQEIMRMQV